MRKRSSLEPTPIIFAQPPASFEQIAAVVNTNSQRVIALQSRDARLRIRGLPGINVDLLYEQPRRFRFRAGTGLTGQELDLGSNDEVFWFWAKQNPQPAIYFARHDTYAQSPNRALLPVEPLWVVDALGLPQFDPRHVHEGPLDKGNEELEIRSRLPAPDGELTRLLTVHSRYGWVMQQQLFDARGRLLASSRTFDHEYYPHAQVALPRRVAIELPPLEMAFQLETSGYLVNQSLGDPGPLFALPTDQLPNYPVVDLNDPRIFVPVVDPARNPYAVPTAPNGPLTSSLRSPETIRR
jgi:hypothetical protein